MSSDHSSLSLSYEKLRPMHDPSPMRAPHKIKYQADSDWDFTLDAGDHLVDTSLMLPHYRARNQPIDHRMSMFVAGVDNQMKIKVCRTLTRSPFYLEVLAETSDVTIWLPSDFKGHIHHTGKATFSAGFVNRILRNVRINDRNVREVYNEDDVVVITRGRVMFRMWDTQTGSPENAHKESFKRMFGGSKKTPESAIDWDFLIKD